MTAPKRRSTHLELVRSSEAESQAAFYAGRLYQAQVTVEIPRKHLIALWVGVCVPTVLMVFAIVLLAMG